MRTKSKMFVVACAAVLVAAGLAAPATAGEKAPHGRFGSAATTAATLASRGVQILKPGETTRVELKSKSKNGVNTTITCYVFDWGPERRGSEVTFEIAISCFGGVPLQLNAHLDMFYPIFGEWIQVPGSVTPCGTIQEPFLGDCVSRGHCWQGGNYYDGFAGLMAYDELGVLHEAGLYAPPRFVGCIV